MARSDFNYIPVNHTFDVTPRIGIYRWETFLSWLSVGLRLNVAAPASSGAVSPPSTKPTTESSMKASLRKWWWSTSASSTCTHRSCGSASRWPESAWQGYSIGRWVIRVPKPPCGQSCSLGSRS
jgi:hypothetical protein